MAAGAAGTTTNFKIESKTTTAINNKPKRRKCREITISAANLSDSNSSPPSPPSHSTSSTPADAFSDPTTDPSFLRGISSNTSHSDRKNIHSTTSYSTTRLPPPPSMEFSYSPSHGAVYDPIVRTLPSSFTKFNSALTAGLLNPMSPPPQQTLPIDKLEPHHRSSPTLFEMMTNEPDCVPRTAVGSTLPTHQQNAAAVSSLRSAVVSAQDKQFLMQQRISQLLGGGDRSPGNLFNDAVSGDIKLTLSDKDGFSVNLNVHREVLVGNSSFFGGRLSERWTKQQRSGPFEVEIADCEDVEIYVETLRLMYCKDLRRILMKEDVLKVLGILKISVAIGFDAGILSCLEYLEAAPWAEDEEEKVASLLSELQLEGTAGAREVLKRISLDITSPAREQQQHVRGIDMNEQVLMNLLLVVLEGKDERASREMKGLVSKMLKENQNHNDLRKESIYSACEGCLQRLRNLLMEAAESDLHNVGQIVKEADNLHWLLDILIDRRISEEFLNSWANQSEMSNAHHKVAPVHRHEVSRVTARLFVGIGKGQLLAPKHLRCLLMKTWLVPFYEDFGWMRRASKGLDRHLIEDGLSNTILTLPLSWQQDILLAWFERFLNSGDDCPNIQRGFEVWWRRAFWRRTNGDIEQPCVRVASS